MSIHANWPQAFAGRNHGIQWCGTGTYHPGSKPCSDNDPSSSSSSSSSSSNGPDDTDSDSESSSDSSSSSSDGDTKSITSVRARRVSFNTYNNVVHSYDPHNRIQRKKKTRVRSPSPVAHRKDKITFTYVPRYDHPVAGDPREYPTFWTPTHPTTLPVYTSYGHHAGSISLSNPQWPGATKREVKKRTRAIRKAKGKDKYEISTATEYSVQELDGKWTIRTWEDIARNCTPGKWEEGYVGKEKCWWWKREQAPTKKKEKKKSKRHGSWPRSWPW